MPNQVEQENNNTVKLARTPTEFSGKDRSNISVSAPAEVKDASSSPGSRTVSTRFAKMIDSRPFLVKVSVSHDGVFNMSFFDVRESKVRMVKNFGRKWIEGISPSVRESMVTSSTYFQENAQAIFKSSSFDKRVSKPKRKPPQIPNSPEVISTGTEIDLSFEKDSSAKDIEIEKLKESIEFLEAICKEKNLEVEAQNRLHDEEIAALSSNTLSEDTEAQVAMLKIQLMDKDSEISNVKASHKALEQELNQVAADYEDIIAANNCKNAEVLEERSKELAQGHSRMSTLNDIVEQLRARITDYEEKIAVFNTESFAKTTELERLEIKLRNQEKAYFDDTSALKLQIEELGDELKTMTESKQQHKEYGVVMKSKLVGMQTTFNEKYEEFMNEKAELNALVAENETDIKDLLNRVQEAEAFSKSLNDDNNSLQHEVANLGLELDRSHRQLEQSQSDSQEIHQLQCEMEKRDSEYKIAHKQHMEEFETQYQRREKIHIDKMKEMKIQLFDLSEELKQKNLTIEQLIDDVSTLMDQQEKK